MSKTVFSEGVHDVRNEAEGVAVPLPEPKPMAEGSGNYGGVVGVTPEPRESIPAVGPAYVAPPSKGSRG